MTLPSARALSRSIFEGSNGPVSGAAEADRPTLMRAGPAASAFSTVRRGNFCIVYLPFAAFREERHGCRHIAGDPLGITPAIGTEPQRARVEGLHVNVRTSIPFRTREEAISAKVPPLHLSPDGMLQPNVGGATELPRQTLAALLTRRRPSRRSR